ncbi:MAG: class I SAM-dependent methyltransferase [Bacteroidia bacterium]|nr:class I SAM-dependent methyltransferase [Bacteroidia bacterium]
MRFWMYVLLALWKGGSGWAQSVRAIFPQSSSSINWQVLLEDPARDAYQKPDELLDWVDEQVGGLRGKKVYDLGAGTGYFSYRFIKRGASVIAVDIEDSLLRYMERRRDSLGISPKQWQIRKVKPDRPDLVRGEVDIVFLANVYHHLSHRVAYLRQLHAALPKSGKIVIIEWVPRSTPVGPPVGQRLFPAQVENELQRAGFSEVSLREDLLPYHYILIGQP